MKSHNLSVIYETYETRFEWNFYVKQLNLFFAENRLEEKTRKNSIVLRYWIHKLTASVGCNHEHK